MKLNPAARSTLLALLAPSLLGSAFALGACGGSVAESPQAASSAATKGPVAQNTHGHVKMMGEALSQVALTPDQRSEIEKLAADADARHQAGAEAHKALALAVADQIEKGAIDRAALQPKVDAAALAFEQARPLDRAALERLHALLDTNQRALFVDTLEMNMHGMHGKKDGHAGHARMEEWAAELKLTDAQQQQIARIVKDRMEEHKGDWKQGFQKGKAMLESFKSDPFVLDEVAPPVDAKANEMTDHVLGFIEQVLPILTPEQRGLAATKVRAHATEPAEMP